MQNESNATGSIDPRHLYTLEAFKRRLGIKASTLRAARHAGLNVYYKHGRGYVLGREWVRYVRSSAGYEGNNPSGEERQA